MIIEADGNLPSKLKDVVDNQLEYLKMEFQKIEEISQEIDRSKSKEIANSETNIIHNRYRDMGGLIMKFSFIQFLMNFKIKKNILII